jgi:hypothetical protein
MHENSLYSLHVSRKAHQKINVTYFKNVTPLSPKHIQLCVRIYLPDAVTLYLIYFRSNGAFDHYTD